MARFFIDTDDDALVVLDEEGQEFPNVETARNAAQRVLPDMARQKMPDNERRTFAARVRDENGAVVYVATLSLVGEWMIPRPTF